LADSGVRESNASLAAAMTGASLIRRDAAVIGGGLPDLAEAVSSCFPESVYVCYGSLADNS
jgi:hypothetical protein